MEFGVITEVPPAGDFGNLATALGRVYLDPQALGQADDYTSPRQPLGKALGQPMLDLYVQVPVFTLGEVLILDGDGREVCGAGRKPGKWSVKCETFPDLESAVACSLAVVSE